MHYDEEKKLTQINDNINSVGVGVFLFFIITLLATCSTKDIIIEKMKNHEKTIINEIRKVKSSV